MPTGIAAKRVGRTRHFQRSIFVHVQTEVGRERGCDPTPRRATNEDS
jgi:hypothetical protein